MSHGKPDVFRLKLLYLWLMGFLLSVTKGRLYIKGFVESANRFFVVLPSGLGPKYTSKMQVGVDQVLRGSPVTFCVMHGGQLCRRRVG